MSEDKKLLKKIEKEKKFLTLELKGAIDNLAQIENENDEKKIHKLKKKYKSHKNMVMFYGERIGEWGSDIESVCTNLSKDELQLLKEIFPQGFNKESIEMQKKRNQTINSYKDWIKKIQRMRETYPAYDTDMPVREKLKNKIYKEEKEMGWLMLARSNPNQKAYDPEWNYEEHFATSTEFTEEEREIMEYCYKVGLEYDAYFDERYGFIADIGRNISNAGQAIGDWGDLHQVRVWSVHQRMNVMPEALKYLYPDRKFSKKELEEESTKLFRQMLSFVADKERLNKALEIREKIIEGNLDEVNELRETSRESMAETKGLVRKGVMKHIGKKVEKLTEAAEDAIVLECMKEALGSEEAIFVFIYTACEEATNGYSKMAEYSFKDLYLE